MVWLQQHVRQVSSGRLEATELVHLGKAIPFTETEQSVVGETDELYFSIN